MDWQDKRISRLKIALLRAYSELGTWERVDDSWGIAHPISYKIVHKGYIPKDRKTRLRLGLYKDLLSLKSAEVRWLLEKRN